MIYHGEKMQTKACMYFIVLRNFARLCWNVQDMINLNWWDILTSENIL